MLQGFKDFIMRGNVVDLAVGVVIGAAFGNVVTAFTKAFLDPLIKLATGGAKAGGQFEVAGVSFMYGDFLNALISFVLTALVVYFVVVTPINKVKEMQEKKEEEAPPEPSTEEVLLTEIRDAIRAKA